MRLVEPGGPCVNVGFGDLGSLNDGRYAPESETGLGYDVFAPLWGILGLGAVVASRAQALRDVSLADLASARRAARGCWVRRAWVRCPL